MNNPCHNSSNPSKDELVKYANYRKDELIKECNKYNKLFEKDENNEELEDLRESCLDIENIGIGDVMNGKDEWEHGNQAGHALGIFDDESLFDLSGANSFSHYQLSTGGDGDGLIFSYDNFGTITEGYYYWEDWGVREFIELTNEDLNTLLQGLNYSFFTN